MLCAPVDLLFNGGIGTYIKAESESSLDVGDRSNDAVRVNGNQVLAKVIGEGGNLGLTALGRVEYDLAGGRINTDALDNSAGVDCSDHEVNIKILVDALITAGKVRAEDRTQLLESMTDEVGDTGADRQRRAERPDGHQPRQRRQPADRTCPSDQGFGATPRTEPRAGGAPVRQGDPASDRTRASASPRRNWPRLMAHVKLDLKDHLLASELPDQEVFASRLPAYFPTKLRDNYATDIRAHQLRREIVTTMLVNDVVDCGGITFAYRVVEEAGVTLVDAVRTFVAVDAIFGIGDLWRRIRAKAEDGSIMIALSDRMTLDLRRLIDRAARWLINYRPQPLAVGAEINRFRSQVRTLAPRISQWLRAEDRADRHQPKRPTSSPTVPTRISRVRSPRACTATACSTSSTSPTSSNGDSAEVADTYFALMGHLNIDGLLTAVSELDRNDHWHALARLAIRDDIYGSLRSLCFDVLAVGEPDESGDEKIAEWEHTNMSRIERARRTLAEIKDSDERDLATLSVAARQIRSMTRPGTGTSA